MGGLVIFPGGWPSISETIYGRDPDLADEEMWRICQQVGHDVYTCPNCADRSCRRCGVGLNG